MGYTDSDFRDRTGKVDRGVEYWLAEIAKAQRAPGMSKWTERCNNIRRLYRDDHSLQRRRRKYAMLWSNMETMKPASYSKPPKAVVQRRYNDKDPVGRVAVEVLERAINFTYETNDFDARFKQVRDDYLLYGRGVARLYYDPVLSTVPDYDDESGLDITSMVGPDREAAEQKEHAEERDNLGEELNFENVKIRFVQRQDFVHQEARTWDEVDWIAFRGFLDREGLIERFGKEIGEQININAPDAARRDENEGLVNDKAEIWEIWDRCHETVCWVSKGWPDLLEEGPPYLKLEDFFPCPRPAFGTLTNDSLDPVPDFVYYQDQAEEIDRLTNRIAALTDALKLVGFYPGGPQGEGAPEIERALTPGFENRLIAVKSWAQFKEGGNQGGAPLVWLPIEDVGNILKACVELRKQLIDDIYQIYGLSDIMRGDGQAQETATAQSIKAQYGSVRIRSRQQELARFCRDISRMTGEIIATHFQPETLQKIVNIQLPTKADVMIAQQKAMLAQLAAARQAQLQGASPGPSGPAGPQPPPMGIAGGTVTGLPGVPAQPVSGNLAVGQQSPPNLGPTIEDVMALLRDNVLRRFRIDIEADSTIVGDESQEREDRTQFIEAVTKYIEAWGPMVAANPLLAKLAGDMLLFGVRSFRVGRELEETIEELSEKLQQMPPASTQGKQDTKVPAEMIKLESSKAKSAAEIQKSTIDAQQASFEAGLKAQEAAMKAKVDTAKIGADFAKVGAQHAKAQADHIKAHADIVKASQPPVPMQSRQPRNQ